MYEKHAELKKQIEAALTNLDLESARALIEEYEKLAPKDMELLNYKVVYNIYDGKVDIAEALLKEGLVQYPLNPDVNYNMAFVYELKQEWMKAYKYYTRVFGIYSVMNDVDKVVELKISEKQGEMLQKITGRIEEGNLTEELLREISIFNDRINTQFGLCEKYYRDSEQCIGKLYWVNEDDRRYIAMQRQIFQPSICEQAWDLMNNKGEFLRVEKGKTCVVPGVNQEYLLPIALEEAFTTHIFSQEGKRYTIQQGFNRHFNYYKVKSGTLIASSDECYYGEPVLLGHDRKRKKLVLNLFIDGLSQTIIDGDDLKDVMPNTYEFFKKGVICTNVHCTADWTYPSLASYVSGLDMTHHMQYHSMLDGEIPKDVKLLSEYFHDAGYYTAKMDGDWRSTPAYGHARGVQRIIYQNQSMGFKEEMHIGDLIDHLEAFQDTDQHIWIGFDDLHNVADGFDASVGAQRLFDLEEMEVEDPGKTSVKQPYSERKKARYIKVARHLDALLDVIYQYILKHYEEDEILISLFADHGQGYLVPDGGHFMSKERTNVAFMIRGNVGPMVTDELISTLDYKGIMCKLAGIELKQERTDGHLPVAFGGTEEREYVFAESMHPGDPYRGTYRTKDRVIYFENGGNVQHDGRFQIKDMKITVEDYDGNVIEDEELANKYYAKLMEHVAPLVIYED